ncbi:MAG: Pr6Pr family membrane protein [Pararhodobacter sp.]|nr:Pr6Pr family membrane protein [Pararhodobacter sp.]
MNGSLHVRLAWLGAALGVVLVIGQAFFTIPLRMTEGGGFWRALVFYFSFFTIWTNTLAVVVYLAYASALPALRTVAGPTGRTLVAGSMLVVMVTYILLLAPLHHPQGVERLMDTGLHYAAPILFLFWWVVGPHPVPLRWNRAGVMLIWPIGYAVWVVARGLVIDRWPYPFVSLPDLGWGRLLVNFVSITLVFAVVFLALIAVSRTLHQRNRRGMMAG